MERKEQRGRERERVREEEREREGERKIEGEMEREEQRGREREREGLTYYYFSTKEIIAEHSTLKYLNRVLLDKTCLVS
jgi:hypothetical protein